MIEIPGYRIVREIGRGGMATVYLAEQESLGRHVALKVLAPLLARDAALAQRFVREGRIAAGLRHRHIVQIFDVGVAGDQPYLALAWLPRGALSQLDFPLDPAHAVRVLRETAAALGHAHRAGVVHRDVKPENILLDDDGAHILTDFGIARLGGLNQSLTAEGSTIGTPGYMAPEQWQGGELDGRADLYSLGVVFYQCLSGRLPFLGRDGWSIGMQHLQAPVPMLAQPHASWQPVLDRLLAKQPAQRFADANALLRAIDALAHLGPIGFGDPAHGPEAEILDAADLFHTGDKPIAVIPALLPRWRRWTAVIALLLIVVLAFTFAKRTTEGSVLGRDPALATILVMPCESFANVQAHRELGDTLAQALIHRLSRLRELTVIASATSIALTASTRDPQALGKRSGASVVLHCSIRRAPEGVRVGAELVETARGTVRWSADFERNADDLLEIVDELALGISERLIDQLADPDRARLMRERTHSLAALAEVDQAKRLLASDNRESIEAARTHLNTALVSDKNFATASALLAQSYIQEARLFGRDAQWREAQVAPLLAQALRQDPDAPLAYVLRSELACAAYQWDSCERDLSLALSLAPADAQVQALASRVYALLGSKSRAISYARRWIRSAPDSVDAWAALAQAFIADARLQAGLDTAIEASQRYPRESRLWRARVLALAQMRRCDEGLKIIEQWRTFARNQPAIETTLAFLFACKGDAEALQKLQRQQQRELALGNRVDAQSQAALQLALADFSGALDTLESMYLQHDPQLPLWIAQPAFGIEVLAGEPRFTALLDRLDLPAAATQWARRSAP